MKSMQEYFTRLVHEIDCCKDQDRNQYFESAPTVICNPAIGSYRECAPIKFSRFAYRFHLSKVQRPHVISISYPDDKERTFCIMDGRTYDLSSGIATGREMPISGKMLTHNIIFWPRWTDCTLMFVTWDAAAPAAVSKVQVFELDDKFFDEYACPSQGDDFRQIGFKWEDPGSRYVTMGSVKRPDWSKRVTAYASAMAQTVIQHPITWYWGCLYPSDVDETDYLEGIVDDNSTTYSSPMHTIYDWVAETIEDLGQKNIQFMGVFHAYRFYNLLRAAQKDGSIRNVNFDGTTQLSTLDWTRTWTRFNIPLIAASENYKGNPEFIRGTAYECTDGMKEIPSDILGEPMGKLEGFCAPIFNCLHPAVEKHLLALMTELKNRYCGYKNFKGITIPLWGATFIWYGSLKTGYDDLTFSLFERENNLDSGISPNDPDRFAKRFTWVTANFKQQWIDWRSGKIKGLISRMRKALAGDRDDVKVVVSAWREPLLSQLLTSQEYHAHLSYHSEPVQLCNSGDLASLLRQGGIDPALYDGGDGVEIELLNDPYRDRSLEIRNGKTPMSNALRDHDFLDSTANSLFGSKNNRNVFIFNAYYESGRYVLGNADPHMAQSLRDCGSGINDLYKVYLVFDHPTWPWFEREFTTCPGVPASGRNFLEYFAHAVAVMDAKLITFGGLLIGCYGHDEDLREFSRAFTSLPTEPFDTVPSNSDAVVVRSLSRGDKTYMYLVNSEPVPMQVKVVFSANVVLNASDAQPITITDAVHTFLLQPYELKAYHMLKGKPVSTDVQLTEELIDRMGKAKAMLKQMAGIQEEAKWYTWLLPELKDCVENAKHSRLRQVFRSYPVKRMQNYL
jgi:hypothetical protein